MVNDLSLQTLPIRFPYQCLAESRSGSKQPDSRIGYSFVHSSEGLPGTHFSNTPPPSPDPHQPQPPARTRRQSTYFLIPVSESHAMTWPSSKNQRQLKTNRPLPFPPKFPFPPINQKVFLQNQPFFHPHDLYPTTSIIFQKQKSPIIQVANSSIPSLLFLFLPLSYLILHLLSPSPLS